MVWEGFWNKVKYDERVSAFVNADNENRETTQEGGTIDDIMGRRPTDVNFGNRWKDRAGFEAKQRDGTPVDDRGLATRSTDD